MVVAAEQPPLGLGDLENRPAHGDAQIGALDQLKPTTHGVAVDGGNHGLQQRPVSEGVGNGLLSPAWRTALDRLLHVLTGAEGAASPGEHGHLELVAVPKLTPGLRQAGAQFLAERVETLRPVHTDHHHLAAALGFDDSHTVVSPWKEKVSWTVQPTAA